MGKQYEDEHPALDGRQHMPTPATEYTPHTLHVCREMPVYLAFYDAFVFRTGFR